MSNRIFKYKLEIEQRQLIHMPASAQIISARIENEYPHIFALVNEDTLLPAEPRIIRVVTTGEKFNSDGCDFIDTVVVKGWFVFHIFEQTAATADVREQRFAPDYEQARRELKVA